MSESLRRSMALLALAILWMLALCAPASAHSRLVEAAPDDGENLTGSPDQVRLRFNEPVEAVFEPIEVFNERGHRVDRDDARANPDDPEVVVASLEGLPEGAYRVAWRVTSLDGHPIHGTYVFSVDATQTASEPQTSEARAEPATRWNPTGLPSIAIYVVVGLSAALFLGATTLRR